MLEKPSKRAVWPWVVLPLALMLGAAIPAALIAAHTYRFELHSFNPEPTSPASPVDMPELRSVALQGADGRKLRAWLLPSRNGATILYAHGAPADRSQLLPEARFLAASGYGALLLDFPGHGESDGPADWGKPSRLALVTALDFLSSQAPPPTWIGALGFSMGSCVLARVASEDTRVRAVVLEGTYSAIEPQLNYEFRKWGPLTGWPAIWAARRTGILLDEMRPIDWVAEIAPRPLLVISGTNDPTVPSDMSREIYQAARAPKELLMLPGVGHGDYARASPDVYLNRLGTFYDRASLGSRAQATRAVGRAATSAVP
jgi:dipeptidyl aminopeptidase/acylaminoacyl peptidase